MTTSLELQAGELRLALRTDLGSAIAGLWRGALPVLRSSEAATLASARAGACYALAPYSNRLGYRRFRVQGRDYTTAPNFGDSPHSVHGVAWQRPWQVLRADAASAELQYRHEPDADWPFAFDCVQRLSLTPEALSLQLSLTNTAAQTQPVGLGWHPYFPKRARSRLHIEISERWDSDASGLPTRRVPQRSIDGDVVHLAYDNCFEGWDGAARIRDEKLALRLRSSLPYLVVYTPQDKDYFCVEPVSHVSNAIHMADPAAHGLRLLPPGERMDAEMSLEVAAV